MLYKSKLQIQQTQKIRVKETKVKIPLRVLARKGLQKFGEAVLNDTNVTLISPDLWCTVGVEADIQGVFEPSQVTMPRELGHRVID